MEKRGFHNSTTLEVVGQGAETLAKRRVGAKASAVAVGDQSAPDSPLFVGKGECREAFRG